MDISKGIVEIDNELVVKPNFTFEQFKETKYYTNQDGIRIIYLDGPQIIKNRKYIVSLFFRDGKIYMLSLICCDEEYSEKDESKRKDLHDVILSLECLKIVTLSGEKSSRFMMHEVILVV